jgi:hypothetical protein
VAVAQAQMIRDLAADSGFWFDNVRVADSTPVECGCSRPTVKLSDIAGWADYGYCGAIPADSGGCAGT